MGVLYQVYLVVFRTALGTLREYVGVTKVAHGETSGEALRRRRRWHLKQPVAWLRCAVPETVRLSKLGTPQAYEDALADEATEAATHIAANPRRCRGGPWCVPGERSVLLPEHKHQVASVCEAVAAAASQAEIRRRLLALPGRALRAHLEGRNFVEEPKTKRVRKQNSGNENRQLYGSSRLAEKKYMQSPNGKVNLPSENIGAGAPTVRTAPPPAERKIIGPLFFP